jgi:hypothetical protein
MGLSSKKLSMTSKIRSFMNGVYVTDTYEIPRHNVNCIQAGHAPDDPHTCPYASELYDSDDICTCCKECTHECAMDV